MLTEEHVLGAAKADALGPIEAGTLCICRIVCIGPDTQLADSVGPAEERLQFNLMVEVRILGVELADENLAGTAVDAQPVAFAYFNGCVTDGRMKRRWATSMASSSAPQTAGVPN